MNLFIETLVAYHDKLWLDRSLILRVVLLPAWLTIPIFYALAVVISKRGE